jgi:hypothetical protein
MRSFGTYGTNPRQKLDPQSGANPNIRKTFIKQNIVENYNVRIPGYSGHKPMSALNDRGSNRPSCLSSVGESFK